eukprot:3361114-Pleurochrysis_carterae.AAC.5
MNHPSGCRARARRLLTIDPVHGPVCRMCNQSGFCAFARGSVTAPCMHKRGAYTTRAAAVLGRAAR